MTNDDETPHNDSPQVDSRQEPNSSATVEGDDHLQEQLQDAMPKSTELELELEAVLRHTQEHLARLNAVERRLLQQTITELEEELVSYRARYWDVKFRLDDMIASNRGEANSPHDESEAEGEVQGAKLLDGVELLLAKARECDQAVPERRFYYFTESSQFPQGLRDGMSRATFRRIIASVKEVRQQQKKRKRDQVDDGKDEDEEK